MLKMNETKFSFYYILVCDILITVPQRANS